MSTKLHINLSQGIIDIEGDPELVREIYSDFKEQLLNATLANSTSDSKDPPKQTETGNGSNNPKQRAKLKRRPTPKKKAIDEESASVVADAPNSTSISTHLGYRRITPNSNPKTILKKS